MLEIAGIERMEIEQKRIKFTLDEVKQSKGKRSLVSDLAEAQSRLEKATMDVAAATPNTAQWNEAESRRKRADSDAFDLTLESAESEESVKVKIGHLLEIQEAILAIKDDHIAKLSARKAAILAGNV